MAGILVADTLQDGAGNSTAMDNAIYGSAKAWVNYAGQSSSVSGSYNVSSVTYNGTGNYTVNFTTALPSTNYAVSVTATTPSGTCRFGGSGTQSTSNCVIYSQYPTSTGGSTSATDSTVCAIFFR